MRLIRTARRRRGTALSALALTGAAAFSTVAVLAPASAHATAGSASATAGAARAAQAAQVARFAATGCATTTAVLESLVNIGADLASELPYCGTGSFQLDGIAPVTEVLPITTDRIWLHGTSTGGGFAVCFGGQGNEGIAWSVPSAFQGALQMTVSDNTAPCLP